MPPKRSGKSRQKQVTGASLSGPSQPEQDDRKPGEAALITQPQSLESVQTLLLGSLSCLAYLRGFFAETCFDDRVFDSRHATSYAAFSKGTGKGGERSPGSAAGSRSTTSMKVLMRGRHAAVDTALDWLETGVFDALEKAVLRGLQINVFEHQDDPSKAMETYTFTVRYIASADGPARVAGLELSPPRGSPVTLKNARHGLQMFIRRLLTLCGTLPDLPKRRYLTMHIFYTEGCDAAYDAPGFQRDPNPYVHFINTDSWCMNMQSCGTLDAGNHSVSLKVNHLVRVEEPDDNVEEHDNEHQSRVPANLQYGVRTLRESALDLSSKTSPKIARGLAVRIRRDEQQTSQDNHNASAESTNPTSPALPIQTEKIVTPHRTRDHTMSQVVNQRPLHISHGLVSVQSADSRHYVIASETQTSTQVARDDQANVALQAILNPVSSQAEGLEETQILPNTLESAKADADAPQAYLSFQLSQKKMDRIKLRTKAIARGKGKKPLSPSVVQVNGDIIQCECGHNHEEGDMLECRFCDRWQHMHCYGYRGKRDERLPPYHACYRCLLEGKEDRLYSELKDFVLLRRAIFVLSRDGYRLENQFAQAMGIETKVAKHIVQRFKSQKILVDVPGSHKKGYAQSGRPKMKVNAHGEVWDRLLADFFDPLAKIAHHFDIQGPPKGVASPPAITPLPAPPVKSIASPRARRSHPLQDVRWSPRLAQRYHSRISDAAKEPEVVMKDAVAEPSPTVPDVKQRIVTLKIGKSQELPKTPTITRKRTLEVHGSPFRTPSPKKLRSAISMQVINVGSSPVSDIGTQYEL